MGKSTDYHIAENAKRVLKKQEAFPVLRDGFTDVSLLKKHEKEVNVILQESINSSIEIEFPEYEYLIFTLT